MSKSPSETPAVGVAAWPMTFVWLGDHWTKDWMRFWTGGTHLDRPAEALREEGEAVSSLGRDWLTAMGALWSFPMTAWLASTEAAVRAARKETR